MKSILFPLAAALSLGATSCTNVKIKHADIYTHDVRHRCNGLIFNHLPGPSGVVLGTNTDTYYRSGEEPMCDAERARLQWIQDHGIGYGSSYYR